MIEETLAPLVEGQPLVTGSLWEAMGAALRNAGRPGIGFNALSAVDVALWDLHAHDRAPASIDIAAGEYAYVPADVRRMLDSVDCLQLDVTRCGGFTGFLRGAAVAAAHGLDVSAHGAPQLAAHACCAIPRLRHVEWFHDHVRLESLLLDGIVEPRDGVLQPDRSRAGHGLTLRRADAERLAA